MRLLQTEADITRYWRAVRKTLEVPSAQLSFVAIDERGVAQPQLTTIDGLAPMPQQHVIDEIVDVLAAVNHRLVPRGSVAVLWTRPGRGPMRPEESAWLRLLDDELRRRGVAAWPPHYANDAYLRVVLADDLAA